MEPQVVGLVDKEDILTGGEAGQDLQIDIGHDGHIVAVDQAIPIDVRRQELIGFGKPGSAQDVIFNDGDVKDIDAISSGSPVPHTKLARANTGESVVGGTAIGRGGRLATTRADDGNADPGKGHPGPVEDLYIPHQETTGAGLNIRFHRRHLRGRGRSILRLEFE